MPRSKSTERISHSSRFSWKYFAVTPMENRSVMARARLKPSRYWSARNVSPVPSTCISVVRGISPERSMAAETA